MADAVVSLLLEKLVTYLIDEGRQLLEFEDQLTEIRKEFQYMQNYINDADRVKRRDRTETLMLIMNDVRELIYDAQEIIVDCQLLCQKRKKGWASTSFSPTLLKSRYLLGKELMDINRRIKEVKQNMISYLATVPAHGRKEVSENIPLTYPVLMSEDSIVGLEEESRQIIDSLLVENDYLKVVGIVGMGGIGKTTLAQKLYKSKIIEKKFKPSIFITVSQSFRFDELVKKMLNKLGVEDRLLHGKDIDDLLEILKNELDGNKYLIVLDDVWEVNERQWWYSLASALPKGKGGCLMVTTRNEEVARYMGAIDEHMYHIDTLSKENSWSLFCKIAFARNGGVSPKSQLETCGKKIVAACGGLPLTIRTVGGMMLGKGDSIIEWEWMLKQLKEEMASSKKLGGLVNSRLVLSYEELPTNLRPCLLCLAVYPEDYLATSFRIIAMWIAEGFVWGRSGKTASEIGVECLNEICNRCLISKDEEEQLGSGFAYYKMHDAVREMLIKIATEESFFSMKEVGRPMTSKLSRRLVMYENVPQESIESNSSRLRTLVAFETGSKVTPTLEANLKGLRGLRVLHLRLSNEMDQTVKSAKWVNGIGSLHHLVYLHLQYIYALTTLPDSIGDLPNLQILNIISCCNLYSLPPTITKLQKLIVLTVHHCEKIECLPKGLGKLSNLEQLVCVKSEELDIINPWISLSELKNLKKLRLLSVDISQGDQVGDEEWTALQMPEGLQILVLSFTGVTPACVAGIAMKMNRPLCHPLQYLKELYFEGYPGESTPTWLSPNSLPNLCHLRIHMGRIKKMGEAFFTEGAAWKVETLVLSWLDELEEDWEIIERAMPFLKLAHVNHCPKLKYSIEAFQPGRYSWRTWKKYKRGESSS